MLVRSRDRAFRRFRATGDPAALGRVFDLTASELLRLARHLASSEMAAEDLLQATFVTAIESRDDHDGERAVLPWLCGVLANHARAARRRARRRPDPSRLPREVIDDPQAGVEHIELRTELVRAIESLPEPYRPVMRLSLEHGLQPNEIARALERSPGTVRAQLSRGLDHLRRALPVGVGAAVAVTATLGRGLAAVRALVMERAGGAVEGGITTTSIGVFAIMGTKVLLSCAAAVVAACVFWFGGHDTPAPVTGGPAATKESRSSRSAVATAPDPGAAASNGAATAREQVTTGGAADEHAALPAGLGDDEVCVRVLRVASDEPVAGVVVVLADVTRLFDLDARSDPATTDTRGIARFRGLPAANYVVVVDRAGSMGGVELPAQRGTTVTIRLPAGARVRGQVLDELGLPVADARVLIHGMFAQPEDVSRSDSEGRFRIDDVPQRISIQARARGRVASLAVPVVAAPGTEIELVLRLRGTSRRISGVVSRADGTRAAHASVAMLEARVGAIAVDQPHEIAVFEPADERGVFTIDAPPAEDLRLIACPRSRGLDAPGMALVAAGSNDTGVEIRLPNGASVRGVVTGGVDARSPALQVSAWPEVPRDDMGYLLNMFGLRSVAVGADGAYELTGLVPGSYRLTLFSDVARASEMRDIGEGEVVVWNTDLGGGDEVALSIHPARPPVDEAFARHWSARVYRVLADGNREFVSMLSFDPKGQVSVSNLMPVEHEILIGVAGVGGMRDQIVAVVGPFVPHGDDLQVEVSPDRLPASKLRGKLVDDAGAPRSDVTLSAFCSDGIHVSLWTATTDRDGHFELAPLVAGDWTITDSARPPHFVQAAMQLLRGESRELGEVRAR